ncbi:MAG: helix-turn-helix domain-containing protein [Pseudomonadota bacterium]
MSIIEQHGDGDTLGGRILRARQAAGLNRVELACHMAVKKSTVQAWESDSREPRSSHMNIMAGVLGVTPTWLLQGVGSSPRGEVEADELRVLKAQLAELEELATSIQTSIVQIRTSMEHLLAAREE